MCLRNLICSFNGTCSDYQRLHSDEEVRKWLHASWCYWIRLCFVCVIRWIKRLITLHCYTLINKLRVDKSFFLLSVYMILIHQELFPCGITKCLLLYNWVKDLYIIWRNVKKLLRFISKYRLNTVSKNSGCWQSWEKLKIQFIYLIYLENYKTQ